jgi:hypothetical protein
MLFAFILNDKELGEIRAKRGQPQVPGVPSRQAFLTTIATASVV